MKTSVATLKTPRLPPRLPVKPEPPGPPASLSRAGRALWRGIQKDYAIIDPGGLAHLLTACRCEDDVVRMRKTVDKDGDTTVDRFGQKVQHPLLAAIRGLETIKRQALASLHLDLEPLRDRPGRPSGVR